MSAGLASGWICLYCTLLASLGCGYLGMATILVFRARKRQDGPAPPVAVSILKPLHGDEPGLLHRLLSFCDQRYEGQIQIVFGCQRTADPAIPIADHVRRLRPDLEIDIVVDERLYGSNRKVSNLINCARKARHDLIVLADSDIEVDPTYLARLGSAIAEPGVGAVTCLYDGVGDPDLGARLSAMAINTHFLPNALVGMALGVAHPCFGSTIALRRDTLEAIGGFQAFADQLADDYAIGDAVRSLGLAVAIPMVTVRHACAEPTLGAFFTHQLRCARTIRTVNPLGHIGSVVANPFPLALIAALGGIPGAIWLVIASMICRLALYRAVERRFGASRQRLWLLPLSDLALFVIFIVSFCGSSVVWRGHRYRTLSDGSLTQPRT